MKKHIYFSAFLAVAVFAGCKDEAEPIPAYLRIEPFVVNEQGGAAWHKITDGWLYVNGEFLGAYTLPATVPVLAEGESEIILLPGVKENGIALTPNIYSFFTRYEVDANLTPPDMTVVQPSTAYDAESIFPWEGRGDLDGSSTLQFQNIDTDSATTFVLTNVGAFAGKSLLMEVDTAHPTIEIATEKATLPATAAQEVWLELHHNNDIPFTLNLLSSTSGGQEIGQAIYLFNETEGWNKIYINLTEFLVSVQQTEHRLFFRVTLPKDDFGKYTDLNGKVMLDNIRLVHF